MERKLFLKALYRIMFDNVMSMPSVLNILGFWIVQDPEYVPGFNYIRILNILNFWICLIMSGYAWMSQNMREYA